VERTAAKKIGPRCNQEEGGRLKDRLLLRFRRIGGEDF